MFSKSSAKRIPKPFEVEAFSGLSQMREWASTAALAGLRLGIVLAPLQYVECFGLCYSSLSVHLHGNLVSLTAALALRRLGFCKGIHLQTN